MNFDILHQLSLLLSLLFNGLLIYLAIFKSHKEMKSYKFLIIYSCMVCLFLSSLQAIVKPHFLTTGFTFAIATTFVQNRYLAEILLNITFGCFGIIICLTPIHLVYRFLTIQHKKRYFQGKYMIVWILMPIYYGLAWGSTTYISFKPTEWTTQILGKYYNSYMDNVVYIGGDYFDTFPGIGILHFLLALSSSVVSTIGMKTCTKIINWENKHGKSRYTRKFQMELLTALMIQNTSYSLLFIPVSMFLFSPIFTFFVDIEAIGIVVTVVYAIYPVIDPILTILLVESYRNRLREYARNIRCLLLPCRRIPQGISLEPKLASDN